MPTPIRSVPGNVTPTKVDQAATGPAKKDFKDVAAKTGPAAKVEIPKPIERLSVEQKAEATRLAEQRQQLPPAERATAFRSDLVTANQQLSSLRTRVDALPAPQKGALLDRLEGLDQSFRRTGQLSEKALQGNDPRQFLALQMEMYGLSKNIELISKVVDQFTSGTKQILQTQV